MSLPPFNTSGDLPVGVHPATLQEVAARFATTNARRKIMMTRLQRIYRIAAATGSVAHFVVFGSFITAKSEPNDVDVFMLIENDFDADSLTGEARWLFDHNAANAFFGASVFWLRRLAALGGEQATIEYWQIKRDGGFRGIIEIIGE